MSFGPFEPHWTARRPTTRGSPVPSLSSCGRAHPEDAPTSQRLRHNTVKAPRSASRSPPPGPQRIRQGFPDHCRGPRGFGRDSRTTTIVLIHGHFDSRDRFPAGGVLVCPRLPARPFCSCCLAKPLLWRLYRFDARCAPASGRAAAQLRSVRHGRDRRDSGAPSRRLPGSGRYTGHIDGLSGTADSTTSTSILKTVSPSSRSRAAPPASATSNEPCAGPSSTARCSGRPIASTDADSRRSPSHRMGRLTQAHEGENDEPPSLCL